MARMLQKWLPHKLVNLLSSVKGQRFHHRQVRAREASRIMLDPSGSPMVSIPLVDRILSSVTGQPLLTTMIRRSGLNLEQLNQMNLAQQNRLIRSLSGRRALQLFYIDAMTNQCVLLTRLLEGYPHILEQIVTSLSPTERVWVFQMFKQPVPELSAPAAEHAAQLLSHQLDRKNLVKTLTRLLSRSKTESGAAALSGLFQEQKLDFGLISEISHGFQAPDHLEDFCRDQGRDIVESCHWHAQQHNEKELANHIQIYMDLIYQALPQYKDYWASCTRLPPEDCPVNDEFQSLPVSLTRLTPMVVEALCKADREDELVSLASQLGWKKIQSQSSATLRNPDAATGDFIYRVFSAELKASRDTSLTTRE